LLPISPQPARATDALSEYHHEGWTHMASSGKKKTTMAKLMRESRLRERRLDKQARKDARKHAPADDPERPADTLGGDDPEAAWPGAAQPALAGVERAAADD
jgi:hypothetical protein